MAEDRDGQLPGKTIIFARNHKHALLLNELFDDMYPQFAGCFRQVIDNYDPRAEQLIDDFKGLDESTNKELTIAISVDMLDTGIDVPEIVNLVFAKPVKSKVKFWQMIGRGTASVRGCTVTTITANLWINKNSAFSITGAILSITNCIPKRPKSQRQNRLHKNASKRGLCSGAAAQRKFDKNRRWI